MSFIAELKRRNVFRVAAAYLVAGWLILEVGSALADIYLAPGWVLKMLVGILMVGFPVALLFSWAYELTPEGLKRDHDIALESSIAPVTAKRLDKITIGLIVFAVAFVLVDRLWLAKTNSAVPNTTVNEPVVPAIAAAAPEEAISDNSIAVLAFTNMSSEKEQEYFADGLSDTLIHVLAQVSGLKVTAKTSSFYFKGKDVKISEIAEDLQVAHVLEGSVQKAGNKIRVIAQLIKASDGSHIWSKNFDRDLADIFAVQDEIAQQVVDALKITLQDTEQIRLSHRYQPTLESYGELILGRQEMAKRTADSLAAAERHFKKAIEFDPDYSLAYVGLADTFLLQEGYAGLAKAESLEYRQPLIAKALELDPHSGEAHTSRAALHVDQLDLESAEVDFLRAIELSPNYAPAHHWYLGVLYRQGRHEESLTHIRLAAKLDPMSSVIQSNLALEVWRTGRVEEAMMLAKRNIERNPEFPLHYHAMGRFQHGLGHPGKAQLWFEETRRRSPGNPNYWHRVCLGFLNLEDALSAEDCANQLGKDHPGKDAEVRMFLQISRAEWDGAVSALEALLEQQPDNRFYTRLLAELFAGQGKVEPALRLMSDAFPELLEEDVEIKTNDIFRAAGFAFVLDANGDIDQRDVILLAIEARIATMHRIRGESYGITDVYIHAIRGDRDQAIAGLREAIDMGWRTATFRLLLHPIFAGLRQDGEFIALVSEMEADILKQRMWYEENKDKPLSEIDL